MRIALISDIHGNLPALETVMIDINNRMVDEIICLGDIVGKGPSSIETIDICRKECDLVIQGNWEYGLYEEYLALTQGKAAEINKRTLWYINSIDTQIMEYMGSLPHSTEFYLSGKLIRLFHAHPQNFTRCFDDSPIEKRLELFSYSDYSKNKQNADVAIYADIHNTYMQTLQDKLLLINVGSVGNPLDTFQASYVILEGGEDKDSAFSVQFIKMPYDIEKAVALARKANVPDLDGYITELRTATYFKRD